MLSFIFCCGPSVICIIKENKLKVRKKQSNEKKKDIFSLDMPNQARSWSLLLKDDICDMDFD